MLTLPIGYLKAYPTPLLLDTYNGEFIAYAFKKLRNNYTGLILQLRRSSNNATVYVNFNADGSLNSGGVAALGAETLYVIAWYSQDTKTNAGSFYIMGQNTYAQQPTFTLSNPAFSNKPTVNFNGSSALQLINSFPATGTLYGITMVAKLAPTDTSTPGTIAFVSDAVNDTDGRAQLRYLDSTTYSDATTGQISVSTKRIDTDTVNGTKGYSGATAGTAFTVSASIDYATGNGSLSVNGTQVSSNASLSTTGVGTGLNLTVNMGCGRTPTVGNFTGSISGFILYPFKVSQTVRTALEAALN
ncbi:MAG: hypothetical protein V7L23_15225 [Nostoc sp.]|uniref:hypothetical protein n=1 Tax=Nostoc sp. TaxID=1180 RepID=UPI002FF33CAC